MKNSIILSCAVLLFFGCVEKKKEETSEPEATEASEEIKTDTLITEEKKQEMEPIAIKIDGSYFKATGTEPFWGLKIYDDKVELQTMEDTITTPPSEAIKAQDGNISMYRIETEATQMDVIISHKECTNAMSGEVFPYTVTVSYKSTGGGETTVYEGCGSYITDYRLHDIWVLEEMKGAPISKENFGGRDVPSMEININNNRFSGFSGCNRMTGSLFYEQDVLRFTQVASTRMACPNMDKETEFLTALQGSTTYKIENNRLYLSNGSEEHLLVFKKID
ncbi:MAG: META domain-containing protein [Bacteroidota bacterium]|uniref:META domain-containing protein n=1 Tax=Flagellimonas profundi TaxID=2915620 RepID=A0ABS3FFG2_9FLAO|nr:META domain-containing protein [Allomuricauda profundi]MBO0341895.1 META domain-containing protein [Allomuricauda profundi]MEC7770626.1 META domain-containing protein [Bacteroidota bacterium]